VTVRQFSGVPVRYDRRVGTGLSSTVPAIPATAHWTLLQIPPAPSRRPSLHAAVTAGETVAAIQLYARRLQ
jgi:hypothetical protein